MKSSILFKMILFSILLVSATGFGIGYSVYRLYSQAIINKEIKLLKEEAHQQSLHITSSMNGLQADVRFLSNTPPIQGIIRSNKGAGMDLKGQSSLNSWKKQLASIFVSLLTAKPEYLQVRFIGIANKGREIVRGEQKGGSIFISEERNLQSKMNEPYMKETLTLNPNEIYISDFNLNKEHRKIVEPYVPVVRVSVPVYSSKQELFGIVIINMSLEPIFKKLLESAHSDQHIYLVNKSGDFLFHPQPNQTFGFEFGRNTKIQNQIPELTNVFTGESSPPEISLLLENDEKAIYYHKVVFDPLSPQYYIGLVIDASYHYLLKESKGVRIQSLAAIIFLILLGSLSAFFISFQLTRPLKQLAESASHVAEGNYNILLPKGSDTEIRSLANAFKTMIQRIRERENQLEENEARIRAIVESAADGIITINDYGIIESVNQSVVTIFGHTVDELIGENIKLLMPSPHRENHDDYMKHYRETGQRQVIGRRRVTKGQHKNGTIFPLEVVVSENVFGDKKMFTSIVSDITERKNMERALLESEERYKLAQEVARIGSWDWNITTGSLYWTNGIFQLFGRTPDEFIVSFDTFLECVHPGDRQHLNDAIAACVKKDEEYDIEHRVILPDGTVRWVSEKGGVTRDEQGNATRMLGIVQDISEKRKVEERLRLLSQAVENNPALIIVTDPKGDIEYVNPKFTEITGYTMEEAIGQNPRILKSGWTHSNDYRNMWQTISSGKEWRGEVYNKNKKGDHYWAQVSISPVMDDMGFIKHYIGLQEDVTSKKSVEIALRNSETKMRLITDNIPASIAFIDIEQRHLFTNRAYNELIQMSADEINLLPVKELGPEISPKFVLKLHEALNGHNVSFEYKFKRDQKSTYLNADYIPHFVDGKVEGVFVLIIDITERKKMEKDLRIAKEQAEQANLAKSTFLASMSHELRTPLNSILGFAQILKSNIKNNLSEKELGYASHILSSGDLLLQLINEVLDLSKIESGKFDLFMEPELLKHVFLETIDQIMAIAYKYKIDVTYLDENLDHYVLVDKKIIRQILMNLLSNAIKYNRAEGNVTLSCKIVDQNFAQIEVLDTGYGIAKENMSKLFDPFCRLGAESKDIEGTGIGLTITKRLVEQLGGSISVKSEVGKGTSFFVTFPLTEQPSLQEKQKEGDFVNPINISEKPLKTILYIEDNNVNLKLVESILEFHQEIKLISAGSAEKGLELAKAHLPDIILMDINLPGMNGIEALANLRNLKSTREIPVVAVTAKAMIEDVEIGKGAGFDGYVTKPIQVVEFKQIIDNLLFDKR